MKITVGMATFKDFDGVYFTLGALRLYHNSHHQIEIVVVDNYGEKNAENVGCKDTRNAVNNFGGRYVHAPHAKGTAASRDLVFKEGTGEVIMCMDCHVLPEQGTIERLADFFSDPSHKKDMVQGPLLGDDMVSLSSHFDPVWRSRMYGIWAKDEKVYGEVPFEIPMQGLGMFAMRKESWPGFNPQFKGFGGEEGYIHEKVRQRGGKCYCHPGMRWLHRFGRPGGVPYPMKTADRIANYIIGRAELGLNYDDVVDHFNSVGDTVAVTAALKAVEMLGIPAKSPPNVKQVSMPSPATPQAQKVKIDPQKGWPQPAAIVHDVVLVPPPPAPVAATPAASPPAKYINLSHITSGVPAKPPAVLTNEVISCLCATFARGGTDKQFLLEEAVESFRRQTYKYKELVVVNDDPTQQLDIQGVDGVVVFNMPRRFRGLGEKWNFLASVATGNLMVLWDDDDIHLPWRLQLGRDTIGDKDYLNPRQEWFENYGKLEHMHGQNNCFHSSMWSRYAHNTIRGFAYNSTDNDADAHYRISAACDQGFLTRVPQATLPLDKWWYIYRWGVSGSHVSAAGEGNENWIKRADAVRPTGRFTIVPTWKADYVKMTRDIIIAERRKATLPGPTMAGVPVAGAA